MGTEIDELFAALAGLDRMRLVELADCGRGMEPPPAFRGRCLDPVYLEAVASGTWSLDDEALLARLEERLEAVAMGRVRRLDRRGLRAVLRGTLLALLTDRVSVPGWADRRRDLVRTWEAVVGPLTATAPGALERLAAPPAEEPSAR